MKKILLALLIIFICSSCSAKTVQVTGSGSTERSAIHNAMRAAIEQELGAHIDAKTFIKNHQVISDEISSSGEGFISSYEIISKRMDGGIFFVEIKAEVDSNAVQTQLMNRLQKKALINSNTDSPRIAVIAYDSEGRNYSEVENEIFAELKRQGFTHAVDLSQVNSVVKNRIAMSENDPALRKTLANDFHIDYLVLSEVKYNLDDARKNLLLSSRLLSVNTGKIIYAGNSTGNVGMFTTNPGAITLKLAARRAGYEISKAALDSAAGVEQHITLLVTAATFQKLGGTLTAINNFTKNLDGVNDAFVRQMSSTIEMDVNFDGTAADFASILERAGLKILALRSDFVKI